MKAITFRLEDDVAVELEALSNVIGASQNQLVNMFIRNEYHKTYEDPKVKKALDQIAELRAVLEKINSAN